jgi:hypothetical protein
MTRFLGIQQKQLQSKDITLLICLLGIIYMSLGGLLLPDAYGKLAITAGWFALGLTCIWSYRLCGRYHCMITGPGLLGIGILSLSEALNITNLEEWIQWAIFLVVLALGYGLEYYYRLKSGTCYTKGIC